MIEVRRNDDARRYEAWIDDALVGFADYQVTDALIVFTHTEVADAHEGQGVGSAIARFALDDVRATGVHQVLPMCPFIKGWMQRHPEYQELAYGAGVSMDEG